MTEDEAGVFVYENLTNIYYPQKTEDRILKRLVFFWKEPDWGKTADLGKLLKHSFIFISSALFTAESHLIPAEPPFLSPRKGPFTNGARFVR